MYSSAGALGVLAALGAAALYGAATILQAVGIRRRARGLLAMWPYVVGLALDGAGFVAAVVALRVLPLFLVQCAVASSVGFTALFAHAFMKVRFLRRDIGALLALAGGLVLIAASALEGPARRHPLTGTLLLVGTVPVLALIAAGWWRGYGPRRPIRDAHAGGPVPPDPRSGGTGPVPVSSTVLLAVSSGLGFAGVGISARVLPPLVLPALLASLALWALLAHGILSTLAYSIALDGGSVMLVAAVTFVVETVVPTVVGLG